MVNRSNVIASIQGVTLILLRNKFYITLKPAEVNQYEFIPNGTLLLIGIEISASATNSKRTCGLT